MKNSVRSLCHSIFSKSPGQTWHLVAIAGLIFLLSGCGVHYVADIPVAVVQVRPVSPFYGAVWVDGGWGWRGGRHVQQMGYWERPRGGRAMQSGEWRSNPKGHYWVKGSRR